MTIRLLDESLINQIAAGEVIERPASIVKELVENSLDAGSTRITVNIGNSGLDTIEVEDNGTGMTGDDLPLAFLRHATSKIKNELDLFKIRSMGFRGEALPSIASVSRIQIISRTEDTEGVCAFLEAGQIIKMEPCAHTRGTRIVVSDLFYNTPVRKKFLKSPVGESRHIYDMVCRYALARPDVSFSFVNEKKTVFKTPGNNSLRDTLTAIYGRDYLQHLVDIRHQGSTLSLAGLVSTPELTRTNRRNQIFFVNRRPVRTPLLFRALDEGYKGLLISRQQPVVILNLSVPAESVDVNVHPQKTEIRFRDEKTVFSFISRVLKENLSSIPYRVSLLGRSPIQEDIVKNPTRFEPVIHDTQLSSLSNNEYQEILDTASDNSESFVAENSRTVTIIGQCFSSYILAQVNDSLWLVDQHAAHERILYHRYREKDLASPKEAQPLAIALTLELSEYQIERMETHRALLVELGFDIQRIGLNSVAIREAPAFLKGQELECLREIIDWLDQGQILDIKREALVMFACKNAIKAGTRLNSQEMAKIITELLKVQDYMKCPHGRPTIIQLSHSELDSMFKR